MVPVQGWDTPWDAGEEHFRIAQDFYRIPEGGLKDEKKERICGVWRGRREPKGLLTHKQGLITAVVCACLTLDHHPLPLYLLKSTSKCFPGRDFSPSVCVPVCLPACDSMEPAAGAGLHPWDVQVASAAGWMHPVCDPGLPGMLCCVPRQRGEQGRAGGAACAWGMPRVSFSDLHCQTSLYVPRACWQ